MKTLTILGRRWFQRTYGNTYHTVSIMIDGVTVHTSERQYGYGDTYLQTAQAWLKENGRISDIKDGDPLWNYCRDKGIAFEYSATDVSRQKDL